MDTDHTNNVYNITWYCPSPTYSDTTSITVFNTNGHIDFISFYGDVMQALPDSSHDQTCDKKIVDTYYLDNCQMMEVQTIDAEQVNQCIMRLKRGKAPGLDDIYHEHLIIGNSEVGEGRTKWAPQPKWAPARLPLFTMVRVMFHYWC